MINFLFGIILTRGDCLIRAGIIGSTGYAGEMLTWILHNHPEVDIVFNAHSNAGVKYSDIYGSFSIL